MPKTVTIYLFAHDTEPSGAPRVTVEVARTLLAAGLECTLVFPKSGKLEEQARLEGLPTLVISNPPKSIALAPLKSKFSLLLARVRALLQFIQLARKQTAKPIFWAGSSVLLEVALAGFVARVPVIIHVHEHLTLSLMNRLKIRLINVFANHLIFVSEATTAPFRRVVKPSRISVIPNRVEPRYFNPPPRSSAFRSTLGLEEQDVAFLSIGFLSPRKGFDLLIAAFSLVHQSHPKTRLLIVGTPPDEAGAYGAQLSAQIRDLGLGQAVKFLGYREDVKALLANADVFVLASRNEALPLSIVEAMAVGCPVIATDVGGVREIVVNEETGLLVPPENVAELAAAMGKILGGPKEKWAASAQRLATERFQPEAIARQLVELAGKF